MACLLKPPRGSAKGVVTFTTPERDRSILADAALEQRVRALKHRWVVGLHHNWHDFGFKRHPAFDFSLAGADALRTRPWRRLPPLIPMDACNFVPSYFRSNNAEKFWDVLYVAHPVFFKRIPDFFNAVRTLYDRGRDYRVLLICPMPPYDESETATVFYEVRDVYEQMFSNAEQDHFTLLNVDFRYPFPFDLPTLAHFYRSSKIFLHATDHEHRARVAAYAWATGIPVVARECVTALLPPELRNAPWCYEAHRQDQFADLVDRALHEWDPNADFEPARRWVSVEHTVPELERQLASLFSMLGATYPDTQLADDRLDIRLGRHHGMGDNPNSVPESVGDFVERLVSASDDELGAVAAERDPERSMAERVPAGV